MSQPQDRISSRPGSLARRAAVLLVVLGGFLGLPASAQDPVQAPVQDPGPPAEEGTEASPVVEVVRARMATTGRPGHRKVRAVRTMIDGGGRIDWSQQGDWIAFDRQGSDGFYQVFIMRPDGTREKCLTCDHWDFRKTHSLSPAFHPSGEHLVFQVQQHATKLKLDTLGLTTPHRGLHSELWVIGIDGRSPFQITRIRDRGGAVVDPHFSYEGDALAWTQRVVSLGRWGEWEPHVARFQVKRGVPHLSKVKNYQPAVQKGFVVAHGFTPNDRGLLISAEPAAGAGRDVLKLDLESGELERLTSSPAELDELVFALPRSDGVVWVSDRNIQRPKDRALPRRGDVWYMSASGRRQERLTFFNDSESDHYLGEALIDDLAWSPDGDRFLVHVVKAGAPGTDKVEQVVYVVELEGALGG